MVERAEENDYVLGTDDEEVARLALQHRVWRPRVLDAWRRAGFKPGQTLLDVGCGPGWASLDLSAVVGPRGHVISIDRSRRFLDMLERASGQRGLAQVVAIECDLNHGALPAASADGAWCRWVLAFVHDPQSLLAKIAAALRPGGILVAHEYFDYATWRVSPRSSEVEAFVQLVMRSWRDSGGEPDVGLDMPRWLAELGFVVREQRTLVDVVSPSNVEWEWPATFAKSGVRRLTDLGYLTPERCQAVLDAFDRSAASPHARMVIPAVLEIIAERQ